VAGFWKSIGTAVALRAPLAKSDGTTRMGTIEDIWRDMFGFARSKTKQVVNYDTALRVTTALRCSAILSDCLSSVPLKMLQRTGDQRKDADDHYLTTLFRDSANEWQDAFQYRESLGLHLALAGNHFSFKNVVRDRVVELIPFVPGNVTVIRGSDYSLRYKVRAPNGEERVFEADAIWHVRGPSWNTYEGLEAVKQCREAIGLALATEEMHATLHANGLQTSGVYSVKDKLNDAQHKQLRAWIISAFTNFEPMILDNQAQFTPQVMTGVDSQHLETRRFQVEEICRGMGVLPVMLGITSAGAGYASVEQMFIAHATHTARPLHRRVESSIRKNLMNAEDLAAGFYPKFIDAELLRGTAESRGNFYQKALGSGGSPPWLTQNEVRAFEDLPPRPEKWANELARGTNPAGSVKPNPAEDAPA
jgi:HK97 family phage portal protein